MNRRLMVLCLAALASLTACETTGSGTTQIREVVSITSFGFCRGYCTTRLEISDGRAILHRLSNGLPGFPDQRITAQLPTSEWNEIARLAASTPLRRQPEVIGCPDCVDQGEESLTIIGSDERTISFSYGEQVERAQPLLERVRALRTRMLPPQ